MNGKGKVGGNRMAKVRVPKNEGHDSGTEARSQLSAEGNTDESRDQHGFSMLGGRKPGDILDCMKSVLEAGVGDEGLDRVISHVSAAA